ncbi:MAG: DUF1700 domain-containing protein [Eubacteriales bacterium]
MTKTEFLTELERALSGLPQEDIRKSLDFYAEMIDERTEDGVSEEEAVAALGDIGNIRTQIIGEVPLGRIVKERIKPNRKLRAWEIVLIALGSPIWLSLAVAAISIIFAVFAVLWSVDISIFAVAFGCGAFFIASIPAAVVFFINANTPNALFLLGCGMLGGGLCLFICMAGVHCARACFWLCKKLIHGIKSAFTAKGDE